MGTDIELPPGETLAAMLDRSIEAFADRIAVTAGAESLSYSELGRWRGGWRRTSMRPACARATAWR
jgi:hypothetical protein